MNEFSWSACSNTNILFRNLNTAGLLMPGIYWCCICLTGNNAPRSMLYTEKWCLEKPSSLQNICVFTWILNNGLRMLARFGWHRTGSLRASCLCCQLFIMFIRCVGRFLTGNYTKQRLVYTLQLSKVPLKKYFEIHKERLRVFIVDTITLHHTTVWWAFIFMISQIHLHLNTSLVNNFGTNTCHYGDGQTF